MNIFEMYYKNDKKTDFWVIRDSWKNTIARVVSISGTESGPLKGLGYYPFFNGAKNSVFAEIYKISKNESNYILEQIEPDFDTCPENNKLGVISCPGTYAYSLVDFSGKNLLIKNIGSSEFKFIKVPITPTFKKHREDKIITSEQLIKAEMIAEDNGQLFIKYDVSKECFIVKFSYHNDYVKIIKSIPPNLRFYNNSDKTWVVDVTSIPVIMDLIDLSNELSSQ